MRFLLLAAAVCSLVAPLRAQTLTVSVKDAPLEQFLDTVSHQSKANFILTEGLADKRVSLELKNAAVPEVLERLNRVTGLAYYEVAPGLYILAAKPMALDGARAISDLRAFGAKLSVRVRGAALSDFFDQVGARTKTRFSLAPALAGRRVTMVLKDVTARQAVAAACAVKGLVLRATSDTSFVVEPDASAQAVTVPQAQPEAAQTAAAKDPARKPDAAGLFTGYRGVSLSLPGHQLAFLKKGDRIDVMVTFDAKLADERKEKVTATILQNVRVVDLVKPAKGEERGTLQILLNPNEAQYAALSDAQGELHVALRAPGDTEMHPMEMASFRKLFR